MQKLLVYYGAFNPITKAHMGIMRECKKRFPGIIKGKIMPTGDGNPYKESGTLYHRVEMCKQATLRDPWINVEPFQKDWKGMLHALSTYQNLCPKQKIMCVMGSDKIKEFQHWQSKDEVYNILNNFEGICVLRNGETVYDVQTELDKLFPRTSFKMHYLDSPHPEVSSSVVRNQIKENGSSYDVDANVMIYIRNHGLYR